MSTNENENKTKNDEVVVSPLEISEIKNAKKQKSKNEISLIKDIPVTISVELGRKRMGINDVLHLSPGAIITLQRQINEPIDLFVNDKLIGHGEIVAIDNYFGVRITNIEDEEK